MTLDEMLKDHAAFLDSAARQTFFDKVDEKQLAIGEDLRAARAAEILATIEALEKRREESNALYDAAIGGYKAELETLNAAPGEKPDTPDGTGANNDPAAPNDGLQVRRTRGPTKKNNG